MKSILGILAFIFFFSVNAYADCLKMPEGNVVCGPGQCEIDQYGKVFCAQPGGGAFRNQYGNVQCGVGNCAEDSSRNVWCSKVRGGGAATNSHGKVKCLGGCEPGSEKLCEEGR